MRRGPASTTRLSAATCRRFVTAACWLCGKPITTAPSSPSRRSRQVRVHVMTDKQASESDIPRLIEIAQAIMPRGALRGYLKDEPPWCRRAGDDAFMRLCVCRLPDPSEIDLLLRAYDRAVARRD